jgi:hypothetical protein
MKLLFRHGIVKYQADINSNPDFLRRTPDNYITLYVLNEPTIFTVSHGTDDYVYEEKQTVPKAWGPFTNTSNYWLYWDIDILTGARTFGHTTVEPVVAFQAPAHPVTDMHWYDKTQNVMKVWGGTRWTEVIRIFAGYLASGVVVNPYSVGSQVGTNTTIYAGNILYDSNSKPVRKTQPDGKGKFLTTESPFFKQQQSVSSIKFETVIEYFEAIEHIPAWYLVTFKAYNKIGVASYNLPYRPAIGIVQQDFHSGETGILTTNGFVTNPNWHWTVPANTPLFCGPNGELVTTVPTSGIIHKVGYVVAPNTVFIEKSSPIHHFDSLHPSATVPVELDIVSGRFVTNPHQSGVNPGNSYGLKPVYGMTYEQITGSMLWEIVHNTGSTNYTCQVFDPSGRIVMPDDIFVFDNNTIHVTFTSLQAGKAQVMFII